MKKTFSIFITLLFFTACFGQEKNSASSNANMSATTLHEFKMPALTSGEMVDFSQYKGKKVVLLNVASECGYTPQYADWELFYREHGDKVLVLGFPANNFGAQEPGSNQQIAAFCQKNYGVTFPLFKKISVMGSDQHPLYRWLCQKDENGWNDQSPSWNFCKYVVDENGKLTHFFPSGITPESAEFKAAVGL